MSIYLLLIAIVPAVILMIYVYRQDNTEREPFGLLMKAFLFGVLSIIPAVVMEYVVGLFTPERPILSGLYTGFCEAGFCEELSKLSVLMLVIWRRQEFNEYFDGIVYATYVALGFACFENITYVFGQGDYYASLATGIMRAVLSVPGHFLFGVMMGYFVSMAKFDPAHRSRNLFRALLYPMLLHGTFDSLLMIPESLPAYNELISGVLFIVFIVFDIKMWKWGIRRIRVLQYLSHQQGFDRKQPFHDFKWDVD